MLTEKFEALLFDFKLKTSSINEKDESSDEDHGEKKAKYIKLEPKLMTINLLDKKYCLKKCFRYEKSVKEHFFSNVKDMLKILVQLKNLAIVIHVKILLVLTFAIC